MSIQSLLMSFCQWADGSWFGHGVRDSVWLFPFVEIFHLLGLGILGGTILMLNMRLMGIAFRGERVSDIARDVRPWMIGSVAVMLVSGFLLFSSEALKMYSNEAFRYKMVFLGAALIFTFTIHRKVTTAGDRVSWPWRWLAALVSFALWAGVGVAGRAIGFV
jgi:hypothetical protein